MSGWCPFLNWFRYFDLRNKHTMKNYTSCFNQNQSLPSHRDKVFLKLLAIHFLHLPLSLVEQAVYPKCKRLWEVWCYFFDDPVFFDPNHASSRTDYASWADSRNPFICYLEKKPISPKISLLFRHNVAIKTRVIPHLCRHRCIFNKASRKNSSPSPLRGQNEQESLGKWGWGERERKEVGGGVG